MEPQNLQYLIFIDLKAFSVYSLGVSCLFQTLFVSIAGLIGLSALRSGPYGLIFSLIAVYIVKIKAARRLTVLPFITDKMAILGLSSYFLYSNGFGSFYAAISGIISGLLYALVPGIDKFHLPASLVSFTKKYLKPFFESRKRGPFVISRVQRSTRNFVPPPPPPPPVI